jgi:hypothetical protein
VTILQCVDRGLEIRAEIKRLKAELDDITTRLENAGLKAPQEDLKDADREGRRWLARGSALIVPVVFTADKIIGEFKVPSPIQEKIVTTANGQVGEFFRPINKWENLFSDGKKFRAHAAELLAAKAPAFITVCLARDKHGHPKSDIKILWDDAEPAKS